MVLSESDIQKIYDSLLEANITDLSVRAEHIEKASLISQARLISEAFVVYHDARIPQSAVIRIKKKEPSLFI